MPSSPGRKALGQELFPPSPQPHPSNKGSEPQAQEGLVDYYAVLGLQRDADVGQILKACFEKEMQCNPMIVADGDPTLYSRVLVARRTLCENPITRKAYDDQLRKYDERRRSRSVLSVPLQRDNDSSSAKLGRAANTSRGHRSEPDSKKLAESKGKQDAKRAAAGRADAGASKVDAATRNANVKTNKTTAASSTTAMKTKTGHDLLVVDCVDTGVVRRNRGVDLVDYYELLDIDETSTLEELQSAHAELTANLAGDEDPASFTELLADCYASVCESDARRMQYDEALQAQRKRENNSTKTATSSRKTNVEKKNTRENRQKNAETLLPMDDEAEDVDEAETSDAGKNLNRLGLDLDDLEGNHEGDDSENQNEVSTNFVNHYEVLDLPPDASADDVLAAYTELMTLCESLRHTAEGKLHSTAVCAAWKVLGEDDEDLRAAYDLQYADELEAYRVALENEESSSVAERDAAAPEDSEMQDADEEHGEQDDMDVDMLMSGDESRAGRSAKTSVAAGKSSTSTRKSCGRGDSQSIWTKLRLGEPLTEAELAEKREYFRRAYQKRRDKLQRSGGEQKKQGQASGNTRAKSMNKSASSSQQQKEVKKVAVPEKSEPAGGKRTVSRIPRKIHKMKQSKQLGGRAVRKPTAGVSADVLRNREACSRYYWRKKAEAQDEKARKNSAPNLTDEEKKERAREAQRRYLVRKKEERQLEASQGDVDAKSAAPKTPRRSQGRKSTNKKSAVSKTPRRSQGSKSTNKKATAQENAGTEQQEKKVRKNACTLTDEEKRERARAAQRRYLARKREQRELEASQGDVDAGSVAPRTPRRSQGRKSTGKNVDGAQRRAPPAARTPAPISLMKKRRISDSSEQEGAGSSSSAAAAGGEQTAQPVEAETGEQIGAGDLVMDAAQGQAFANHYEVLGAPVGAGKSELESAYTKAVTAEKRGDVLSEQQRQKLDEACETLCESQDVRKTYCKYDQKWFLELGLKPHREEKPDKLPSAPAASKEPSEARADEEVEAVVPQGGSLLDNERGSSDPPTDFEAEPPSPPQLDVASEKKAPLDLPSAPLAEQEHNFSEQKSDAGSSSAGEDEINMPSSTKKRPDGARKGVSAALKPVKVAKTTAATSSAASSALAKEAAVVLTGAGNKDNENEGFDADVEEHSESRELDAILAADDGKFVNYYVVLGVAPNTTMRVLNSAYAAKVMEYHPQNADGGRPELYELVNRASDVLLEDAAVRDAYHRRFASELADWRLDYLKKSAAAAAESCKGRRGKHKQQQTRGAGEALMDRGEGGNDKLSAEELQQVAEDGDDLGAGEDEDGEKHDENLVLVEGGGEESSEEEADLPTEEARRADVYTLRNLFDAYLSRSKSERDSYLRTLKKKARMMWEAHCREPAAKYTRFLEHLHSVREERFKAKQSINWRVTWANRKKEKEAAYQREYLAKGLHPEELLVPTAKIASEKEKQKLKQEELGDLLSLRNKAVHYGDMPTGQIFVAKNLQRKECMVTKDQGSSSMMHATTNLRTKEKVRLEESLMQAQFEALAEGKIGLEDAAKQLECAEKRKARKNRIQIGDMPMAALMDDDGGEKEAGPLPAAAAIMDGDAHEGGRTGRAARRPAGQPAEQQEGELVVAETKVPKTTTSRHRAYTVDGKLFAKYKTIENFGCGPRLKVTALNLRDVCASDEDCYRKHLAFKKLVLKLKDAVKGILEDPLRRRDCVHKEEVMRLEEVFYQGLTAIGLPPANAALSCVPEGGKKASAAGDVDMPDAETGEVDPVLAANPNASTTNKSAVFASGTEEGKDKLQLTFTAIMAPYCGAIVATTEEFRDEYVWSTESLVQAFWWSRITADEMLEQMDKEADGDENYVPATMPLFRTDRLTLAEVEAKKQLRAQAYNDALNRNRVKAGLEPFSVLENAYEKCAGQTTGTNPLYPDNKRSAVDQEKLAKEVAGEKLARSAFQALGENLDDEWQKKFPEKIGGGGTKIKNGGALDGGEPEQGGGSGKNGDMGGWIFKDDIVGDGKKELVTGPAWNVGGLRRKTVEWEPVDANKYASRLVLDEETGELVEVPANEVPEDDPYCLKKMGLTAAGAFEEFAEFENYVEALVAAGPVGDAVVGDEDDLEEGGLCHDEHEIEEKPKRGRKATAGGRKSTAGCKSTAGRQSTAGRKSAAGRKSTGAGRKSIAGSKATVRKSTTVVQEGKTAEEKGSYKRKSEVAKQPGSKKKK